MEVFEFKVISEQTCIDVVFRCVPTYYHTASFSVLGCSVLQGDSISTVEAVSTVGDSISTVGDSNSTAEAVLYPAFSGR